MHLPHSRTGRTEIDIAKGMRKLGMSLAKAYFPVAAALLLGACASSPTLTSMTLDPPIEGSPHMMARATFLTRACDWHGPARVRVRRADTSDWKDLPAPAMVAGEIRLDKTSTWEAPVPVSDTFRAGETYDVQWTIPYSGSSFIYDCPPEKSPRNVVFLQSFGITPAFAIAAAPASVEVAPGSSTTFDVTVQKSAGFAAPVIVTMTGLPPGITITPPAAPIMETSRAFNMTIAADVPPGTYTADVKGASPNRSEQHAPLTVVVRQP